MNVDDNTSFDELENYYQDLHRFGLRGESMPLEGFETFEFSHGEATRTAFRERPGNG